MGAQERNIDTGNAIRSERLKELLFEDCSHIVCVDDHTVLQIVAQQGEQPFLLRQEGCDFQALIRKHGNWVLLYTYHHGHSDSNDNGYALVAFNSDRMPLPKIRDAIYNIVKDVEPPKGTGLN